MRRYVSLSGSQELSHQLLTTIPLQMKARRKKLAERRRKQIAMLHPVKGEEGEEEEPKLESEDRDRARVQGEVSGQGTEGEDDAKRRAEAFLSSLLQGGESKLPIGAIEREHAEEKWYY